MLENVISIIEKKGILRTDNRQKFIHNVIFPTVIVAYKYSKLYLCKDIKADENFRSWNSI